MNVDLAIIGAGPAGSAAAITAAAAGLRVLIIEQLAFPRHRPGETLPPGVEPLFKQLGVWEKIEAARFIRHPGHRVTWGEQSTVSRFGGSDGEPWLGFQAWRPTLDAILLRRAAELGAKIWQPCAATNPMVKDMRVSGVRTDHGKVRAKYLIDATGGRSWLAQKLGSVLERRSSRLVASYGYLETDEAALWSVPAWKATAEGWLWMAQVRAQTVAWTQLSLRGRRSGMPAQLATLKRQRPLDVGGAAADVTWRLAKEPAGDGYFLAGDAASVLDPACSHGVLRALMTGIMAAHLSAQVLRFKLAEEAALAGYADWVRRWFDHDAKELERFYSQLATPPFGNSPFGASSRF